MTADTRTRLLEATTALITEKGLVAVTTKSVAQRAGVSEMTLFRLFATKHRLLLATFEHRSPHSFLAQVKELPCHVGVGSIEETLNRLMLSAIIFFNEITPMLLSLQSDPELARQHFASLEEGGSGPQIAMRAVADYLAREQAGGRLSPEIDPSVVARAVLDLSFQYNLLEHMAGGRATAHPPEVYVRETIAILLRGILPITKEVA